MASKLKDKNAQKLQMEKEKKHLVIPSD